MQINWFPGHMMKSMRMMEENIRLVDCILYVLDARIPNSCFNPYFAEMIGDKPIVYLLNKSDLAEPAETEKWIRKLSRDGNDAMALNATTNRAVKDLVQLIDRMEIRKRSLRKEKGLDYVPRAMVVGVPNTGKSTVINMLVGKAKTITGDKAGVTRGKQWVRVEGKVDLLDTPGTLPKKLHDEIAGVHLSYVGSIKDEITDAADLAYRLIGELVNVYPGVLSARYGIDEQGETLTLMERIAVARGFKLRGGEYDYDRTAFAVLDDFRKGRMGRLTLERVEC